jgi:hypothetical protein
LPLLALGLLVLPIHVFGRWPPPAGRNPIPWLLVILLVSVGLPFFLLSTIAPTLQAWYANTEHRHARDPYFLYGVSNVGSIVALLSYPIFIEPHLRLTDQTRLWSFGYVLLLTLTLGCAMFLWRSPRGSSLAQTGNVEVSGIREMGPITFRQRIRWATLAFVPSSLMLGVTTTFTTDFPPIPLLWVVPLAIFLLTFALAFSRKPPLSHEVMIERLPFLILMAIFPIVSKTEWPVWLMISLDLLMLFVASMVCNGELVASRPSSSRITEFYLLIAAGGVAGGIFSALVAPLIFNRVLEYPLALILAALVRPSVDRRLPTTRLRVLDVALPLTLGAAILILLRVSQALGLRPGELLQLLVFAPALVFCLSFGRRSLRFAVGVAALFLASTFYSGPYGPALYTTRSFFGVYRVTTDPGKTFHLLIHGSTVHGIQSLDLAQRQEPLSYYSRGGPVGDVFDAWPGTDRLQRVAVVGLGAGTLATYGKAGQEFTFYEIDPAIERIARNDRYFSFLRNSAADIKVILGDARLSLTKAPDRHYDLIILDAFSSDAIPLHLLTREAMQLYLAKLTDHGILTFNISNRYLDLEPVVADLANDAGLFCLFGDDSNLSPSQQAQGNSPSQWVVMARRKDDLSGIPEGARWKEAGRSARRIWTDDFSNVVSVIRWSN